MKRTTSRTKIKKNLARKLSPEIVETIELALKHKPWTEIAKLLSSSTSKYSSINLKDIDKQTSPGDTVVIPGKVLGVGNLTKKLRICALGFSSSAREKAKSTSSELVSLAQEIKINQKAEGIKIIN